MRRSVLPELDTAVAWPGTTTGWGVLDGSDPKLGGVGELKLADISPRTEARLLDDEPTLRHMMRCTCLAANRSMSLL